MTDDHITPGHRALSAAQFADVANSGAGGASMDVASSHVYQPGEKVFFVGGEPDVKGEAVPEHVHYGPMTAEVAESNRQRVGSATGNRPGAISGTWHATKREGQPFVSDASRAVRNKRVATNLMFQRNEDSIWDMGRMEEVGNKVKRRAAAGKPIYRAPGQ